MSDITDSVLYKVGAPILSFLAGFLVNLYQRKTLTANERLSFQQKSFENTKEILKAQADDYQSFAAAIHKYNTKTDPVGIDDFFSISTEGEKYFYQQATTANAVLGGRLEEEAVNNTIIPKLRETIDISLPAYYRALRKIADDKGFHFTGKLRRENYESIYRVVEKHTPEAYSYLYGRENY